MLDGDGFARLGEERFADQAGSILVRPPSSRVAHALVAGDGGLTYLAYGTRDRRRRLLLPALRQARTSAA